MGDRSPNGSEKIAVGLQLMRNQVRDHFGIGVGSEDVGESPEASTQRLVVLDDPVMDHGQPAGDVRMGVPLARHAVRRPARMSDAGPACGLRLLDLRRQFGNPANRPQTVQTAVVDQGEPGRVVAAVFELAQTFKQDGDDIAVSDRGNDATHGQFTS
ncbi:MAG: hypothetical protein AW07_00774 [Candidatus Accumulibacter sp. SK-11]|nr:MAG: hypothetical protein AW07_00774 [Candidatus Accumulibacter sp. SK-11]